MTLGNMRELGVPRELCHHGAILRLTNGATTCSCARSARTQCGIVGADARPDWREMQVSGNWRRT